MNAVAESPAAVAPDREDDAAVVSLQDVRCRGAAGEPDAQLDFQLAIRPTEVVMVRTPRPAQAALLAGLCAGVIRPARGSVRFLGHDWSTLDDGEFNALRSLIGRVFYRGSWLDHLSIAENVLLPQLHHTRLPRERLLAEAALLARRFGLPGLPTGDPRRADRRELQYAACVRALLGRPRLLVLEHPTAGVYPDVLAPLIAEVRAVCDRGGAVLWMTLSENDWCDLSIPVSRRLRVAGRALLPADAAA